MLKPTPAMRLILLAIAILSGITLSAAAATDVPVHDSILLSGSDWKLHDDPVGQGIQQEYFNSAMNSTGWISATVPGNVQADVEAAHQISPLWYGPLNPKLYDVARRDWWYRKDFTLPASYQGRRITLDFDGVDEHCKVWLNGKLIGENGGMFRRFWFDVSAVAQPGKVQHLSVQISRMPEELVPLLIGSDGPLSAMGTANFFLHGINRTRQILKDLKTPGNWSYDWSTNVWTLGIWKDVRIQATGPARIDWTRVETKLDNNYTHATIHTSLEVDSLIAGPAQAKFFIHGLTGDVSKTVDVTLTKGRNIIKADLSLDHPALWWPSGQGAQPLYTLKAQLVLDGSPVSDQSSTRFGVREFRWVLTQGVPADFPVPYQLLVNNRPVRCIGSGIIHPYILPGCGSAHNLQLLHFAKNAGMNYFRINGGGGAPLFDDAWFDLADELGIMVHYEYPAGNSGMEADPVFLSNLKETCRNMIKQSRNHPCITEYVGGNEMGWNSGTRTPALQLMQKIAAEESDCRFLATDPDIGSRHSPWDFDIMQDRFYHHYGSHSSDTPWYGEFGTASPANLEVWYRECPPASQWPLERPDDPILIYHNALYGAFGPTDWLFKPRIDAAFGYPDNLPELVAAGQYCGAEGLRFAFDGLRRKGNHIGGISNHCFSEPWPNLALSGMVDYDGRTLMNYDFVKQAMAPISLSLQFDSCLYTPEKGIEAEMFLVSDAPLAAEGLHATWLARDRDGTVLDHGEVTAAIAPQEVKSLGMITIHPPEKSSAGPIFIELHLSDAAGKLLVERVQIFGRADMPGPFAGLLNNRNHAPVDATATEVWDGAPNGPDNLAFVGNGAKPATASSARGEARHQPAGINDGLYGNDHSWIGTAPRSWFQIDLGKVATVGCFKLGRDRTGILGDRAVDYLKIETSLDAKTWQTVYEQAGMTGMKGYSSNKSIVVCVAPVQAEFVKTTVDSLQSAKGELACVDEFEVFGTAKQAPAQFPQVQFPRSHIKVYPTRRTTLEVAAAAPRMEGDQAVLDLTVHNTGVMTALFCEPHPLLNYRTDLYIDNKNCFIPPGESRVISIRASSHPSCGLSLAQTGWTVSTWNADTVTVDPSADVLLSVGRQDVMCREFMGYDKPNQTAANAQVTLEGNLPDTTRLPYIMRGQGSASFKFDLDNTQAGHAARLRIYTADQAADASTTVQITMNGHTAEAALPAGLGIQNTDPAHRAYPASLVFDLSGADLHPGKNELSVRIKGDGWFTWDSLDLVRQP